MHKPSGRTTNNPPSRAIVLAAGRGRRLIPHTNDRPKPLLTLDGRPLLDYTLEALAMAGVTDVCLVLGYLAEQIERYVGDGSNWSLRVVYRRQKALRGTADALLAAKDFLTAPCFVVAADYALASDYLVRLKEAYKTAGTSLAVSLKQLARQELAQSSSVLFGLEGQILRIVEKPRLNEAPSQIAASLIYIVPPTIRNYLADLQLSPRHEFEMVDVINQMLEDGYTITGLLQTRPREWQS